MRLVVIFSVLSFLQISQSYRLRDKLTLGDARRIPSTTALQTVDSIGSLNAQITQNYFGGYVNITATACYGNNTNCPSSSSFTSNPNPSTTNGNGKLNQFYQGWTWPPSSKITLSNSASSTAMTIMFTSTLIVTFNPSQVCKTIASQCQCTLATAALPLNPTTPTSTAYMWCGVVQCSTSMFYEISFTVTQNTATICSSTSSR